MKLVIFLAAPLGCRSFRCTIPQLLQLPNNIYTHSSCTPQQPNCFRCRNTNIFPNQHYLNQNFITVLASSSNSNIGTNYANPFQQCIQSFSKSFCQLAPLWTLIAAAVGIYKASSIAQTIGSLSVMQKALSTLMLAMGLTITPKDFKEAAKKPSIIFLNAFLCFGMMPLISMGIASALNYNPNQTAGIILLGSVSGGQASNLFTLLAGGDVALSVVCTISTTFLGVLATPLLIKYLLQTVVEVRFMSVLQSVANLVLLPLSIGLITGKIAPRLVKNISPFCPIIGVLSTMILVADLACYLF